MADPVNHFGSGSTAPAGTVLYYYPNDPAHHATKVGEQRFLHRTPDNSRASYLGESAALNVINEEVLSAVSPISAIFRIGMILGQVSATKRWRPWTSTATDGSQIAAGIFAGQVGKFSDQGTRMLATVRGPATVNGNQLQFYTDVAGVSSIEAERNFNRDAAAALAFPQLAARGMKLLNASKPDYDRMPYWGPDSHRAKPVGAS